MCLHKNKIRDKPLSFSLAREPLPQVEGNPAVETSPTRDTWFRPVYWDDYGYLLARRHEAVRLTVRPRGIRCTVMGVPFSYRKLERNTRTGWSESSTCPILTLHHPVHSSNFLTDCHRYSPLLPSRLSFVVVFVNLLSFRRSSRPVRTRTRTIYF